MLSPRQMKDIPTTAPPASVVERLFVYGTLGPGRPNEHILGNIGGCWEQAWVTGTLHEDGWGAELGFPGVILGVDGVRIEGLLFSSESIMNHWTDLDAFEGEGYRRVLTQVERQHGATVEAYIYTLKREYCG